MYIYDYRYLMLDYIQAEDIILIISFTQTAWSAEKHVLVKCSKSILVFFKVNMISFKNKFS